MRLQTCVAASGALAMGMAATCAQAQVGHGYGEPPPPPYAYAAAPAPARPSCEREGFTILGAHAGVTVLGFGLKGGAKFTAPVDCGGEGDDDNRGAQFTPRPYAPPAPPSPAAYPPPPYNTQDWSWQGGPGGYPPPCGCEALDWRR